MLAAEPLACRGGNGYIVLRFFTQNLFLCGQAETIYFCLVMNPCFFFFIQYEKFFFQTNYEYIC